MTKTQVIDQMVKKANALLKGWTRDGENEIWNMALDWNREHEDDEIFMCEYQSEDSATVNGFMIEDDYWCFEN